MPDVPLGARERGVALVAGVSLAVAPLGGAELGPTQGRVAVVEVDGIQEVDDGINRAVQVHVLPDVVGARDGRDVVGVEVAVRVRVRRGQ